MSRKLATISIVLFLIISGLAFWSGEEKSSARGAAPTPALYVAAEGRVAVQPDHRAVLSAEVSGRIDRLLVDNLSPVRKGDLLAVLYNADLERRILETEALYHRAEARYKELVNGSRKEDIEESAAGLQKAEADVELSRNNEQRDRQLFEEGVVAHAKLDASVADLRRAESEWKAARERYARLVQGERAEIILAAKSEMQSQQFGFDALKAAYEKTMIRSPLNGIVILRYRNVSEFADVGDPIVEVADLSEIIVEGDVNEMDAGKVSSGQKAMITSDAFPGKKFSGQVYEVSASLKNRVSDPEDPAIVVDQKILPVKIRLLGKAPLKLGMKVDLKILL